MLQENHIVGKSICRKNLSQKILLQENHIPGNTSSLASSFFVFFFCEATEEVHEQKITTAAEGAKRPGAAAGERSRMPGKSEATEQF